MNADAPLKVLGISGSLRKESFNTRLLGLACDLAPAGMTIDMHKPLVDIPVYNGDDEDRDGIPPSAVEFREAIRNADGILIVTPEYNFSIPGGLKNAIDWASRADHPFKNKPMALMGAAAGPLGSARAQYHLRQSMGALECLIMPRPEIFVGAVHTKFDDKGNFTDEVGRELISQMVKAFQTWILQVRP